MSNLATIEGIDKLGTSRCTDFSRMFSGCENLSTVDASGFNTSQATSFNGMFYQCENISSVNVSAFDTSQATDFAEMFDDCIKLNADCSSWIVKEDRPYNFNRNAPGVIPPAAWE